MVAKITMPKSIMAALNYNENKMQKGHAACLYAANYLAEAKNMNFYQKLAAFERLNDLNERATTKTLHVSLNFDPSENLPNEKLTDIACAYMEKIGFGRQLFLVYRHFDAGHPHVHIVSTTIQSDGSRINTHNIGRNQSEQARKEIEQQYNLVKASQGRIQKHTSITPVDIRKAEYGRSETKQTIASVVLTVFNEYKFTSLPEFNAALRQFNIMADRGSDTGRIFKHRGLMYRLLDNNGNKIGVPIKASTIGCRPTLANLEKKFDLNASAKERLHFSLRAKLDECLTQNPQSIYELVLLLQQKNVYTVLRQNTDGRIYGITFVDNLSKLVCNGSDLGKAYSTMGLQNRLGSYPEEKSFQVKDKHTSSARSIEQIPVPQKQQDKSILSGSHPSTLVDTLLSTKEATAMYGSLVRKKRKKKQKKPNS